jgi:hypothetical protein
LTRKGGAYNWHTHSMHVMVERKQFLKDKEVELLINKK